MVVNRKGGHPGREKVGNNEDPVGDGRFKCAVFLQMIYMYYFELLLPLNFYTYPI